MKRADDVKEKIINVTTCLITESDGNIDGITTRMIAEKASIGIGVVNYHFQTKDNLIEICIQRIINNVISTFSADHAENDIPARLKHTAKRVMDFLMDNASVSRISMLGDYKNPKTDDNTMGTIRGFSHTIGERGESQGKAFIMLFALTSTMASMFLRRDMSKEIFGADVHDKRERDALLENLIDILLLGFVNMENTEPVR